MLYRGSLFFLCLRIRSNWAANCLAILLGPLLSPISEGHERTLIWVAIVLPVVNVEDLPECESELQP